MMTKGIKAGVFPALIFFLCIFFTQTFRLEAEKTSHNGTDKVKILILSKTVRLLKEGKTGRIAINPEKAGDLFTGEKRIPCRSLLIYYRDGSFHVSDGKNIFTGRKLTLYPEGKDETFSVRINEENRIYPLPLFISNTGSELELSVEETTDRYAIDSAVAELGHTTETESEALYALAHLVKARCALPYLKKKHEGYDFCDLTCCQSYKGKSGKMFIDPVSIRNDKILNGLFFHASGGGELFTESIFSTGGKTRSAPKDIIYSENFLLSSEKYHHWSLSITASDIAKILFPGEQHPVRKIIYDKGREVLLIETGSKTELFSPESFRLALNRVRGWNFLKSNNYILSMDDGVYRFTGSGLGHGTGMSMEGALQLAQRGYSRYEILEHYYPELEYNMPEIAKDRMMQYILFDLESGAVLETSTGTAFMNRTVPCGSVFKLFIALYLASERKDIFYNYYYTCSDREKDKFMPEKCWNRTGHGKMNITAALCHSCNKYFASLYNIIDYHDFRRWIGDFAVKKGIALSLPEFKQGREFASLLAGLDFTLTITINGLMKLAGFIYTESRYRPSPEMEIILAALHKTFTEGTAKDAGEIKLLNKPQFHDNLLKQDMWGKTGTVIAGTNSHHGYGIFTGGNFGIGIVSLHRKGTGTGAAKISASIISDYLKKIKP